MSSPPLRPWFLTILAGAVAALAIWWGSWQRDRAIAAEAEAEAALRTVEVLNDLAYEQQAIEGDLRLQLEDLENVPDSQGAGPPIRRSLGLLHDKRATSPR